MAKKRIPGRLQIKRLRRINKTLSIGLKEKEKNDLNDYITYLAEESRYEYLLNQLDNQSKKAKLLALKLKG